MLVLDLLQSFSFSSSRAVDKWHAKEEGCRITLTTVANRTVVSKSLHGDRRHKDSC